MNEIWLQEKINEMKISKRSKVLLKNFNWNTKTLTNQTFIIFKPPDTKLENASSEAYKFHLILWPEFLNCR